MLDAHPQLQALADLRLLGSVLDHARRHGGYDLLFHHQQGEFHHDLLLRLLQGSALPGGYLLISTNCNGGVKEVLCFAEPITPSAVWHARCPDNPEFEGSLPTLLGRARTEHYFDPCELLAATARSELKPEHRARQPGGGWCKRN